MRLRPDSRFMAGALRGALLLLLAVALAGARAAEDDTAGRVVLILGEAIAVNADGTQRDLERNDSFQTGDTLRTSAGGRMQLRFTDGSRMSLRPESELVVEDYEFDEDSPANSDNRQRMRLTRGGFRTTTGSIAENNRDSYRVRTPFAVMGVRGTDWSAVIDQGNLLLGVLDGRIFASNNGGEIELGQEQDFDFSVVRSFDEAPQGLNEPPQGLDDVLSLDMGGDESSAPSTGIGPEEGPPKDQESDGSVRIGDEDGDGELLVVQPGDGEGEDETVFEIQQRCL